MYPAIVRVTGAGRLIDFRERVRWLMVRDPDAERYVEAHSDGVLEYRFEIERGIPFPAFASASAEFPELRVEAEWHDAARGVRGSAVMENGRLVEQSNAPLIEDPAGACVETADDGTLRFAVVCAQRDDAWLGYCADGARHAYFRAAGGALEISLDAQAHWTHRVMDGACDAHEASIDEAVLAELEELAHAFAADWLWFDEAPAEDTALERSRYEARGWPVRGANLRLERALAIGPGGALDRAAPEARPVLDALYAAWKRLA